MKGLLKNMLKTEKGFTLMELMVALTVLSVIVVLLFGAMRIGVKAWEKGESKTEGLRQKRIVLTMMGRQLASIHVSEAEQGDVLPLRGTDKTMVFTSLISLLPDARSGPRRVYYRIEKNGEDGERLLFYERTLSGIGDASGKEKMPNEENMRSILSDVYQINFGYWVDDPIRNEIVSKTEWDPKTDFGVPHAVTISIRETRNSPPIIYPVRIMGAV